MTLTIQSTYYNCAICKSTNSDATDSDGMWKCDGCMFATWPSRTKVICSAVRCPNDIERVGDERHA